MKTLLLYFPKIAILICFFITANVKGQIYLVEEWVQTSGMPDTIDYSASKVDGSGNIYVTTNTISATEKANILTTKYNSSGVVQWEVEKDNADENDYGSAIEVDGSGNVYVGAATWVDGTNKYDYMVIKYNSSGTQQWTATYNGTGSFYDIPTDIYVDGSGNVYVTGYSYGSTTLGDFCTIKYNSSGTAQWTSRYDYASDQDAAAIVRNGPGSTVVVIGASENTPGDWDFAAVQYNASTGAQVNTNRNSASGSGFDQVYSADVDASGNIYISGRAAVVDEGFNMRTVKLEPDLDLVWVKNHDHAELDDEAHGVIVDLEDNVYVTGWVTNEDQTRSMLLVKYNSAGTLQWYKQIDAPNAGLDVVGLKISSVTDGNIVIAGNIDNGQSLDFIAAIYNPEGDLLWLEQYDSPDKADDKVNFVKADMDDVFYVGGKSYGLSATTNRLIKYSTHSFIIPPDDDTEHIGAFTYFENKGQIIDSEDDLRPDIKFYTQRFSPSLYLFDNKLSYVWARVDTTVEDDTITRIDMSFVGGKESTEIHRAVSQGGEYLNYYLSHCLEGIRNIRSADRLIVPELYDNVDLEYYFDNSGLKYYLIIKPGWSEQLDPISILYDGAEEINILGGGELQIVSQLGSLTQQVADAYQIDAEGDLVTLGWDADYVEIDDFEIGFDLGAYDNELPLIIEIKFAEGVVDEGCDNNVIWGTVYGGDEWDYLEDIKYAPHSGLYVGGSTGSHIFPDATTYINDISSEYWDFFIQKFRDDYSADWGTYVGGEGNEGADAPKPGIRLCVSPDGTRLFFAGRSDSPTLLTAVDFDTGNENDLYKSTRSGPVVDGIAGFLNIDGSLGWLTFIGGDEGYNDINGILCTKNNHLILVGRSEGGADFPFLEFDDIGSDDIYAITGAQGCIIELNEIFEPVWGTLFGGGSILYEAIRDVCIDENTNKIYLTGTTNNSAFPTTIGAYQETFGGTADAFIAKIDLPTKSLDWCTYFGADGAEEAYGIAANSDFVYIAGQVRELDSGSPHFPTYSAGGFIDNTYDAITTDDNEGFILQFTTSGVRLWASYLGGEGHDALYDVAAFGDYFIVSGYTFDNPESYSIESFDGAYNDNIAESEETSVLSMFNAETDLVWSTLLGNNAFNYSSCLDYDPTFQRLYVGGELFDYDDVTFNYQPVCDPGGSYYYPIPVYYPDLMGGRADGYINAFDMSIFPDVTTDIEVNNERNLILYPNPTNGLVTVDAEGTFFLGYELYNSAGQLIIDISNIGIITQLEVNLESLNTGLYFLNLITDDAVVNLKVIKN
ncbi:MAG TPA: SBBP repeat-containing protein [Chitinophagales bacterium]|nr:SBBP repeat-containing protein [Chitinophagales bacterium]